MRWESAGVSPAAQAPHISPASTSTGAELRCLEKAIFSKGEFSLKAQSCWGRAHPSPCQEGSLLREGWGWLPRGLFLAAVGIPPPQHLVLRDKAIQYLQEHIWHRGSTINLPHFNTPYSQLAIAASSQPGSEQLLEAAIPSLLLLLPAEPGARSPHCLSWTSGSALPWRTGLRGILSVPLLFLFPKFLVYLLLTQIRTWFSSESFSKHTQRSLGDKINQERSPRTHFLVQAPTSWSKLPPLQ